MLFKFSIRLKTALAPCACVSADGSSIKCIIGPILRYMLIRFPNNSHSMYCSLLEKLSLHHCLSSFSSVTATDQEHLHRPYDWANGHTSDEKITVADLSNFVLFCVSTKVPHKLDICLGNWHTDHVYANDQRSTKIASVLCGCIGTSTRFSYMKWCI